MKRSEEEGRWPDRHRPDGIQMVLNDEEDDPGLRAKNPPLGERLGSHGLWGAPSVRSFGIGTDGFLVISGFWDGLGGRRFCIA